MMIKARHAAITRIYFSTASNIPLQEDTLIIAVLYNMKDTDIGLLIEEYIK